jgi:hypothetical protein
MNTCLTLKIINEYNHATRAFKPMILAIISKDTVTTLHQLHPPFSNLVLPPIFYYQFEQIFVFDRTLLTLTLTTAPHLSSGGLP